MTGAIKPRHVATKSTNNPNGPDNIIVNSITNDMTENTKIL